VGYHVGSELVRKNWSGGLTKSQSLFRPELLTQSETVALALWALRNHLKVFSQRIPNGLGIIDGNRLNFNRQCAGRARQTKPNFMKKSTHNHTFLENGGPEPPEGLLAGLPNVESTLQQHHVIAEDFRVILGFQELHDLFMLIIRGIDQRFHLCRN
jgi:hypothetical protein